MRGPTGAYYASQDADSEGCEGKFFVWTPQQIAEALGDDADPFCTTYGVRLVGNFENGTTHLVDEARAERSQLASARAVPLEDERRQRGRRIDAFAFAVVILHVDKVAWRHLLHELWFWVPEVSSP